MLYDPVACAKSAILAASPGATVYDEPRAQNIEYPFYFVTLTSAVRRPVLNRRFTITYSIKVYYYPEQHTAAPFLASRAAAELLDGALRVLSDGVFSPVAKNRKTEIAEGVVTYAADYTIRVREPDAETMQDLEVQ